ncbi:MAG: Bax inhibitor-1/YccA family protein [Actinomycetes bacterium]
MANPVLTDRRFDLVAQAQSTTSGAATMTKAGVLSATGVLFVFLLAGATAGWWKFSSLLTQAGEMNHGSTVSLVIAGIVAFVVGLVAVLVPKLAKILGPVYAICEGFLIGAVSKAYDVRFHGIVVMAVGATVAVALTVYALYATGTIKVTKRLRSTIVAATIGLLFFYVIMALISVFGGPNFISTGGPLAIGFTVITAGLAASNLLLDFDFIDRAIASGANRNYEWYAGLGIMMTLVWLYLELLRLLSYFRD